MSLDLCALFLWFYFIFSRYPLSLFHHFGHSQSLTSEQYLLLPIYTNYQPKMYRTDSQTFFCGSKMDCVQTCEWTPLACGTHLPPTSDFAETSPQLCGFFFFPPPFLFFHTPKTPEKSGNRHRQRMSDGLNLKWTGTGLCRSAYVWSFHFSLLPL